MWFMTGWDKVGDYGKQEPGRSAKEKKAMKDRRVRMGDGTLGWRVSLFCTTGKYPGCCCKQAVLTDPAQAPKEPNLGN